MIRRQEDGEYGVIRLNRQRDDSWAVVGRPSGAIALDDQGGLLMRLGRPEAESLAAEFSRRAVRRREQAPQMLWRIPA